MAAIIGDLSIKIGETVLTARTDVGLAEKWAAHVHGPQGWAALTFGQRMVETADALAALRAAFAAAGDDDGDEGAA